MEIKKADTKIKQTNKTFKARMKTLLRFRIK